MSSDEAARAYQRNAAAVTDHDVLLAPAKGRRLGRRRQPAVGDRDSKEARREADEVLAAYEGGVAALRASLSALAGLRRPGLLGKAEQELSQLERAVAKLAEARGALDLGDLGTCGSEFREAHRELSALGGALAMALNQELAQAAVSRQHKAALQGNMAQRRAAQEAAQAEHSSPRGAYLATAPLYQLMADGFSLAATVLGDQAPAPERRPATVDAEARVLAPHELPTFADVGGLEEPIERLRRTVGGGLERSGRSGRSAAAHNGILLHGPPGTGKTLLARATAGEYGLRFVRFSPALIASAYQHEPARKLHQLFALAAASAPCLLFLDEVETIAGRREAVIGADQRELVTQLLNSLEEYRDVPGLIIMAATNAVDRLDPALREGRFDSRIAVPMPDAEARRAILEVLVSSAGDVDWDSLDLDKVAEATAGRSGAALAAIVSGAEERALARGGPLTTGDLADEIEGRSGQDRAQTLEEHVGWGDVVLPEATRQRLEEILLVFQRPELGRRLGVRPPAGILLHGPPGTGKTTVAKALASEVKASFYEQSAADLLSKWVGESEQKVAELFARARDNRPSIIFCDEIDAVLKRRSADSSSPWEERVVSQFLRELDGLHSGEGVLLVGSTNRADIIDEAVRGRRLEPIEVPLPDEVGRARLLELLCHEVRLDPDVDLAAIAGVTEGMSGADLRAVRNGAGMKALTRAARLGDETDPAVTMADVTDALAERGVTVVAAPAKGARVRPPAAKKKAPSSRNAPSTRGTRKGTT